MDQYRQKQTPRLLEKPQPDANITIINEVVELDISGKRTVVPTADAFRRLVKKVAILEQRLSSVDNKATRAIRQNNE